MSLGARVVVLRPRMPVTVRSPLGAALPRAAFVRAVLAMVGCMVWVAPAAGLEYEYRAPAACADRAELVNAIVRRLKYPADESPVARVIVTVVVDQGYHRAEMVLVESGVAPVSRSVVAQDCDQAVNAIALVAALALDERYRERAATADGPATSAPDPGTGESRADAAASEAARTETGPEPTPAPAQRSASPPRLPTAPPAVPESPAPPPALHSTEATASPSSGSTRTGQALRIRAELGAFAATGYSPEASLGPLLGFALRADPLEVRLRGFYAVETTATKADQRAQFFVMGGRLLPCYRLSPSPAVTGVACASFEGAAVVSEGLEGGGVVAGRRSTTGFWAAGLATGLEFRLSEALSLNGDFVAQFPLLPGRFRFKNADSYFHEYPAVALRAELALGVLF